MGRPAVTIYDIAFKAGVSQATVSRVLSGHAKVSTSKREAVLSAIRELNYRPNLVAQGLARGRSHAIGILTMNTVSPFFGRIIQGIEQALNGTGYRPLIASVAATGNAKEALELLLERQVEALILVGGPMAAETAELAKDNFPVAGIGPTVPGLESVFVQADNVGGAMAATRHLLDLGHRNIALINGPLDHQHAIDRLDGYRRALSDAGVAIDPARIIHTPFDEATGAEAAELLLQRAPGFTAIFAASDQLAYGAMLTLYRHGLKVPADVSVVGFDDQIYAAYAIPPLTTVRQQMLDIGAALAQMVISRMQEGETPFTPGVFSTELVVRDSTAPPRKRA